MAGKSPQEKAAEDLYSRVTSADATPFQYKDMYSGLRDLFGHYKSMIDRDTSERIASQQKGAAESLASRGITGGSILADTQSKIGSELHRAKTNALSQLAATETASIGDLQKYFNQRQFDIYGLIGQALKGLDNTTWLDDTMALGKDLAEIYSKIKK